MKGTLISSSASDPNLQKDPTFCCFCLGNISQIRTPVGFLSHCHCLRLGPSHPEHCHGLLAGLLAVVVFIAHSLVSQRGSFSKTPFSKTVLSGSFLCFSPTDAHQCGPVSLRLPLEREIWGGPQFRPISKWRADELETSDGSIKRTWERHTECGLE